MRRPLGVPILLLLGGVTWAGVHMAAHRAAHASGAHGAHGHHGEAGAATYLPTSLTLCLSLALVLAATSSLHPRWRGLTGRSLWLFGAVPVLGLLAGAVADAGSLTGVQTNVAELLPVAGLVLIVQAAVALSAVRLARALLDVVEAAIRALAAPRAAGLALDLRGVLLRDADLVRGTQLVLARAPRGPPTTSLR